MGKKIAYSIICCLFILQASGQDYTEKELRYYDKVFVKAEEALYKEDFETALENYEILVQSKLNYGNRLFFNAELCSLLTQYQNKSVEPFLSYEEELSQEDKFYHYWKGRVLMRKYEMQEAGESLTAFLDTDQYLSKEIQEEAKKWIVWANNAQESMDEPDPVAINVLEEINTEYAELSPVYFGDHTQVLFLSNKDSDEDKFHVYHAYKEDGKKWSTPSLIESLGVFTRENANIQLIAENKRLYHYKEDGANGGIYYSEYSEETKTWSSSVELDKGLSLEDLGAKFYLNAEQNRILFVKDMGTKRFPNLDIMESFKDPVSGKWSKPNGISEAINSRFNEDGPYLSPDGMTLYFASEGHGSIGGFDIFRSDYDEETRTWSTPTSMGFPINSPDNEIQFKMNDDQKGGHFTSNRLNTEGYDIFFFWEADRVKVKGSVRDHEVNQLISDAQIYFRPLDYSDMYFVSGLDDQGKYETEINTNAVYTVELKWQGQTTVLDTLEVAVSYDPNATIERDFYFSMEDKSVDVPLMAMKSASREYLGSSEPKADSHLAAQQGVQHEQLEKLGSKFRKSNRARLNNIYFDFGTSQIKSQGIDELISLKELLEEKQRISVEIAGHTDNIGSDDVNEWLSFNRANAIKAWLVENGIDSNRMIAKGYGSRRPLASNDDELDGRELNRRIEIVVQE